MLAEIQLRVVLLIIVPHLSQACDTKGCEGRRLSSLRQLDAEKVWVESQKVMLLPSLSLASSGLLVDRGCGVPHA